MLNKISSWSIRGRKLLNHVNAEILVFRANYVWPLVEFLRKKEIHFILKFNIIKKKDKTKIKKHLLK